VPVQGRGQVSPGPTGQEVIASVENGCGGYSQNREAVAMASSVLRMTAGAPYGRAYAGRPDPDLLRRPSAAVCFPWARGRSRSGQRRGGRPNRGERRWRPAISVRAPTVAT